MEGFLKFIGGCIKCIVYPILIMVGILLGFYVIGTMATDWAQRYASTIQTANAIGQLQGALGLLAQLAK